MKRLNGGIIAVALALVFVLLSAGAAAGLTFRGIQNMKEDNTMSVSEEFRAAKLEREARKAERELEKAAEQASKATLGTPVRTTSSTTAKKTTTTTKKSTTTSKKTATTTKKTTTTAKKTTTTTKKATTTAKKTTQKTTETAGNKIIYLTFDDGPGQYTDKLLGILDKYDVKATFFVTNCYPKYQDCIAKEYRAGHAVAVHSYTHDYATVYKSDSAYWNDFDKMNAIVKKQTGKETAMFRFPGGSSNTVSRKYNSGIMSRLVKQAGQKGLTYYDWNVSSGDAGETTSSEQVYKNIISGVQKQERSIVLCHDIKSYTVNAMDKTISWCLDHGYTFRVLTPSGYTVHHSVAN